LLKEALGDRMAEPIRGEKALEDLKRYRIERRDSASDCWVDVRRAICAGQKVLWVCNTVKDAVNLYEEACGLSMTGSALVYHSHFRYKDRVGRQKRVIDEFNRPGETLVIATQVCEMSLDISADLLVTALPPFPALIQRLGRLNRRARKTGESMTPQVCACLVYDFTCVDGMPYKTEELRVSRRAVRDLTGRSISQTDLAQGLAALPEAGGNPEYKYSAWLDGVWETDQRPLREGGVSITVLMRSDLPEILKRLSGRKPNSQNVAAWTLPMPFQAGVEFDEPFGGYPVVSDDFISYVPETGARWKKMRFDNVGRTK
jgi:CRISPR-associated endonuclease/helicase Cas3